jgi:hypothetical protein
MAGIRRWLRPHVWFQVTDAGTDAGVAASTAKMLDHRPRGRLSMPVCTVGWRLDDEDDWDLVVEAVLPADAVPMLRLWTPLAALYRLLGKWPPKVEREPLSGRRVRVRAYVGGSALHPRTPRWLVWLIPRLATIVGRGMALTPRPPLPMVGEGERLYRRC